MEHDHVTREEPKPSTLPGTSRQSWAKALLWLVLAGSMALFGMKDSISRFFTEERDSSRIGTVASVLGSLCLVLVHFATRRGRQHLAESAQETLAKDTRPPVVYLRSFAGERDSQEDELAVVLNEIGPFVAIGNPHEKLPLLGAARMYVGDDEWREVVTDLMQRAQLVVVRAGSTEGLMWELRTALQQVSHERLLILVPWGRKQYEAFRRQARELFPHPLPEYSNWGWSVFRPMGFLYFEPDWTPVCVRLGWFSLRLRFSSPTASLVKLGLRPVFERLHLPYKPLRLNPVALALLGVFVAGLVWLRL